MRRSGAPGVPKLRARLQVMVTVRQRRAIAFLAAAVLLCLAWLCAIMVRPALGTPWWRALAPIGLIFSVTNAAILAEYPFPSKDRLLKIALLCNPCAAAAAASVGLWFWRREVLFGMSVACVFAAVVFFLIGFRLLSIHIRRMPSNGA